MYIIYGYTKCSTVRKAITFLTEHDVDFKHIDNVENKLTPAQLKHIHLTSHLEIKRLFNTSGMVYRDLNLKDKISTMTDNECYHLLATNEMLVKRPILLYNDNCLIGFKQEEWISLLL